MENAKEQVKVTPKDFFLNLGWVVTLYGSVISLLNLLFETINRVFPDALNTYYRYGYYSSGIRWAIAWLIVLFPVYIFINYYLRKMFSADESRRHLWIRKWFIYLTLFLSLGTALVDIVVIINNFLGGELTTRFLFKAIATLAVAGMIFGYYFYELKADGAGGKRGKIFAIVSSLAILASLVWAFAVIGSPASERARRFDEQRVQHLQDIQWRITNYWQLKQKLPENLGQLNDSIAGFSAPVDPETGASYEYRSLGAMEFELCATFNQSTVGKPEYLPYGETMPKSMDPYVNNNDYWNHLEGRRCFTRKIDAELYPPKTQVGVPVR